MKRLLFSVLALAALGLALSGTALVLALRLPPPPEPTPASEPAPQGVIDQFARLLGIDTAAAGTTYRVLEELALRGEAEVTAPELGDITTTALNASADGREILSAAEPIRVRFHDARVEVGAVLDLREIDSERLGADAAGAVESTRRYAPMLATRPIFVALDTTPVARDGDLDLGEHARFRIGSLPLPGFLARALGLDARLRAALNIDLRLLDLRQVEIRGERLYLRTAPASGN